MKNMFSYQVRKIVLQASILVLYAVNEAVTIIDKDLDSDNLPQQIKEKYA